MVICLNTLENQNTKIKIMGDSIKKWEEIRETKKIISEGHKTQAYQILVEYPEEAILEAARILLSGK
jgi:hypothetical protein